MSDVSNGDVLSHKRNADSESKGDDESLIKRQKTGEIEVEDDQLNAIFNDPLPGFGGNEDNSDKNNENGKQSESASENIDIGLPKEGDPLDIDFDNLPTNFLDAESTTNRNNGSHTDTPNGGGSVPNITATTNSTSMSASPNNTPRPTPLSKANSRSGTPNVGPAMTRNLSDTVGMLQDSSVKQEYTSKQEALKRLLSQMPASINRMNHLAPQNQGIQGLNTSSIDRIPSTSNKEQLHTNDPSKLNDALAAAGVDIQHEEELLMQQHLNRSSRFTVAQPPRQRFSQSSLLNPYHIAAFMQRVARENGVMQNFYQDTELLELMSTSCENWLSNILTKTIIMSRHRRRGISTLANTNKSKKTGASNANATPSSSLRSELSKELRNLASKQKEMEERRVSKRMALGLETNGMDPANGDAANGKAGAEETLHRAANATAAMMTMNPSRKKYSWMTANAGASNGDDGKSASEKDGKSKQSSIITARGDNGLRFREIRTGNSVTMKDLLGALEDEKMGAEKAIIKGYAKLKD